MNAIKGWVGLATCFTGIEPALSASFVVGQRHRLGRSGQNKYKRDKDRQTSRKQMRKQ